MYKATILVAFCYFHCISFLWSFDQLLWFQLSLRNFLLPMFPFTLSRLLSLLLISCPPCYTICQHFRSGWLIIYRKNARIQILSKNNRQHLTSPWDSHRLESLNKTETPIFYSTFFVSKGNLFDVYWNFHKGFRLACLYLSRCALLFRRDVFLLLFLLFRFLYSNWIHLQIGYCLFFVGLIVSLPSPKH